MHEEKMIILAMVSAMHLESNIWHGICQSWWTVTHIHLSLSVDKQDKTDLLPWTCSNLLHNESLGKRISTDDLTHGILCHIMSQHFRRQMCLFQCYLLLVIKWRQRCFSGAMLHEMGSKENEPAHIRCDTRCSKIFLYIIWWQRSLCFKMQQAASVKFHQGIWQRHIKYQSGCHVLKVLQMELLL